MSNESLKTKFELAQQFVSERKWESARAVLKTIEHSKAREWELRINKLSSKSKRGTYIKIALIIAGILFVVLALTLDNKRASDNMAAFKQQQASDQQASDLQSCILKYPDNSKLVQACMTSLGH